MGPGSFPHQHVAADARNALGVCALAEAPGSRTQPAPKRAATDFEDREGHRAPFASGSIIAILARLRLKVRRNHEFGSAPRVAVLPCARPARADGLEHGLGIAEIRQHDIRASRSQLFH